ncbi:MAG: response regulator [Treponema sp.]|jgi:AraC-like DNA-binding protein/CheY-like chemotaxis protein|nr:response regulator [Treponema sp.]
MFKVLAADDEPIILSGVKHLIDWEKNNCILIGTTSNGEETLEEIRRLRPDIVICDIGMPVCSGLEVLKKTGEEFPETVFIMLTNHEDFDLARESLRYRAVEYLLKNRLEAGDLEKALALAAEERENRGRLKRVKIADECLRLNRRGMLEGAALRFLANPGALSPGDTAILEEQGLFGGFGAAFIPVDYSTLPDYGELNDSAKGRLFKWEKEIAGKLISSFFNKTILVHPENSHSHLLFICWGISKEEWETKTELLRDRLIKTSSQITQLGTGIMTAGFFTGADSPARQLAALEEFYHRTGNCRVGFDELGAAASLAGTEDIQNEAVRKARQFIHDNIDKRIGLRHAAGYAAVSPGYLSTLFKKELKVNLMDYINQAKVEKACELIRRGKYRIYEISCMLGFENAYYFTRVFHRHTGLSPTEYQKTLKRP